MLKFTLRRTAQMAIVVFGVVTLVFFILRIASGDPANLMNPPGQPFKRGTGSLRMWRSSIRSPSGW